MDFKDQIKQLSERVEKLKDSIVTEEATKNALIMPFIQALGYDVFDPTEIVPEFTCDIGTKKGEKIDYAILRDGKPVVLVECKHWQQDLNLHDNQLLRYFNVANAKFGILTNGIVYRFYTDLDVSNKMDEKPFLEVNITDVNDSKVEELKKFHKSYFDIDNILNSASELKYTSELKVLLKNEFENPSPEFVKMFARQVYDSIITAKVLEQFTLLTKKSIAAHINELISDRLKLALKSNEENAKLAQAEDIKGEVDGEKITTTVEELEGFMVVKALLRSKISIERISYKDTQSYFAILLDGSVRKTICRLFFGGKKKLISFFDEQKKDFVKHPIETLDDIFGFQEQIIASLNAIDKKPATEE
jgi:hypothetical protein